MRVEVRDDSKCLVEVSLVLTMAAALFTAVKSPIKFQARWTCGDIHVCF